MAVEGRVETLTLREEVRSGRRIRGRGEMRRSCICIVIIILFYTNESEREIVCALWWAL